MSMETHNENMPQSPVQQEKKRKEKNQSHFEILLAIVFFFFYFRHLEQKKMFPRCHIAFHNF